MKGHYGLESTFSALTHNKSSSSGLYDGSANSCPYFKDAAHPQGGTVYVVAGSAGQLGGTQSAYPHNAMHYSNASNGGSMVLEFDDNRLDAKWLCADGVIRDKFTIVKNSNKETQHTITAGQNINLTASWNGSYVWSTGATSKTINVAPASSTTYIVRDQYTCIADTFNVTVNSGLMSAGQNTSFDAIIQDETKTNGTQTEVSVFPNPFKNELTVKYSADKNDMVSLELIDLAGSRVISPLQLPNTGGENTYKLNTSSYNLKTGIYIVKITTGKSSRVVKVNYIAD
jgi:hypothetical protein